MTETVNLYVLSYLVLFMFFPKYYISDIYKKAKKLANEEYRIQSDNGINKYHGRANEAQQPKSQRQMGRFDLFGIDPLIDESKSKDDLCSTSPDNQPEWDIFILEESYGIDLSVIETVIYCQDRKKYQKKSYEEREFLPPMLKLQISYVDEVGNTLPQHDGKIIP